MGLGPVHAATPILKRNNLGLNDLDYWEINEAFAAQVLGCLAAWKDERYCKEQLGLDGALGSLDELPRPREIDELLADPRFARERADLLATTDPRLDATPEQEEGRR